MSENEKRNFDQLLTEAISSSLSQIKTPSGLRDRLLGRLTTESSSSPSEEAFEQRLSEAVAQSQEWAMPEEVSLKTEIAISQQLGKDVLSERSVRELSLGASPLDFPNETAQKKRFVEVLSAEVKRASGELEASPEIRDSVVSLVAQNSEKRQAIAQDKVTPLPSRWPRRISAMATMAAGFALVLLTVFGTSHEALANSVRNDHEMCCQSALRRLDTPRSELRAVLEKEFGKIPIPKLSADWILRTSKMCHTEDGYPMIHQVYSRTGSTGQVESLSLHFLPKRNSGGESIARRYNLSSKEIKTLSDNEFPVLGWSEVDWVCTICSKDLDTSTLKAQIQQS